RLMQSAIDTRCCMVSISQATCMLLTRHPTRVREPSMSTSTQRASRFLIEQDEADYAATAAHQRDVKAWPAESGAVLDPLDELRILESWLEDHEGAATNAGSLPTPRIANVTHFERPTIRGEVDAALAADEEVHVSDALTGEDLGAAIVNERWWTLKDPRALAHGQVVV